jgi:HPt (histidine-containing phosphotransfer) domain-containing protein
MRLQMYVPVLIRSTILMEACLICKKQHLYGCFFAALTQTVSLINLAHLEEWFHSDNPTYREVLQIYIEDAPTYVERIRKSFAANDWELLNHSAHKLIGLAAFFNIKEAMSILRLFESEYQTVGKLDTVEHSALVIELESVIQESVRELEYRLSELTALPH